MIGNLLGRFGLAARIGLSISAAVIAIEAPRDSGIPARTGEPAPAL